MHTITIIYTSKGWMSYDTDPAIKALFGTGLLPTAFTSLGDGEYVRAEIARLNPTKRVVLVGPWNEDTHDFDEVKP